MASWPTRTRQGAYRHNQLQTLDMMRINPDPDFGVPRLVPSQAPDLGTLRDVRGFRYWSWLSNKSKWIESGLCIIAEDSSTGPVQSGLPATGCPPERRPRRVRSWDAGRSATAGRLGVHHTSGKLEGGPEVHSAADVSAISITILCNVNCFGDCVRHD